MNNKFPNVDELIKLAKTDPERLERLRKQQVESLISSAPENTQRRLRGLQFQIDCQRKLHPTGMGACMAITTMMFDSLQKLNEVLHGEDDPTLQKSQRAGQASVIKFPAFGS